MGESFVYLPGPHFFQWGVPVPIFVSTSGFPPVSGAAPLGNFLLCGKPGAQGFALLCLAFFRYKQALIFSLWISILRCSVQFSSVQSLSRVRLFGTPWIAARPASLSITNSHSSLRLTSIESVMPSSHLILCCPLLLLPTIPPSIRVFSSESALRMRCPKYWSFSFSIIPSKEIPGLISFRIDWLDLLEVQGTLKSLLQHHSSKASILWRSAFFTVQLSHPYMTTGKTIALIDGP